ncbi:hypothetical protein D4764_09G0004410, partial [Takifugu flavidus]
MGRGGIVGEGECDNEKRRTTSVFARCSFYDPHLALSPSTMPYQCPNRSPDCNSLPNLNLHADEQISLLSSPSHPEDPPSHAMAKMSTS